MKKILISGFILAQLFVSCTSDLEDTVANLEQEQEELLDMLDDLNTKIDDITFEKVSFTHNYGYDEETNLSESFDLYLSSVDEQYMKDNGDGTYTIEIGAWEGTEDDIEAEFDFIYDSNTNEVTSIERYEVAYDNRYDDWIRIRSTEGNVITDTTGVEVHSIDVETGAVSATFTLNYTGESSFAEYAQAGEIVVTFDGVLRRVYVSPNISEVEDTEVPVPLPPM